MKKLSALLLFAFLCSGFLNAQSKVKERDILGVWTLHIDLKQEIKNQSSALNFLEKAVVGAVSGIVDAALEQVDIRFNFKRKNVVLLKIHSKEDNTTEEEVLAWRINANGQLEIDDAKNEKVNIESDGVWMLKDKKLVVVSNQKVKESVYMVRD